MGGLNQVVYRCFIPCPEAVKKLFFIWIWYRQAYSLNLASIEKSRVRLFQPCSFKICLNNPPQISKQFYAQNSDVVLCLDCLDLVKIYSNIFYWLKELTSTHVVYKFLFMHSEKRFILKKICQCNSEKLASNPVTTHSIFNSERNLFV